MKNPAHILGTVFGLKHFGVYDLAARMPLAAGCLTFLVGNVAQVCYGKDIENDAMVRSGLNFTAMNTLSSLGGIFFDVTSVFKILAGVDFARGGLTNLKRFLNGETQACQDFEQNPNYGTFTRKYLTGAEAVSQIGIGAALVTGYVGFLSKVVSRMLGDDLIAQLDDKMRKGSLGAFSHLLSRAVGVDVVKKYGLSGLLKGLGEIHKPSFGLISKLLFVSLPLASNPFYFLMLNTNIQGADFLSKHGAAAHPGLGVLFSKHFAKINHFTQNISWLPEFAKRTLKIGDYHMSYANPEMSVREKLSLGAKGQYWTTVKGHFSASWKQLLKLPRLVQNGYYLKRLHQIPLTRKLSFVFAPLMVLAGGKVWADHEIDQIKRGLGSTTDLLDASKRTGEVHQYDPSKARSASPLLPYDMGVQPVSVRLDSILNLVH